MAIIAAQRAGPGSGVEAKQSSAWMEILCMPSEKGKARRATGLNAGNKRSLINEDSMYHNTDACQLFTRVRQKPDCLLTKVHGASTEYLHPQPRADQEKKSSRFTASHTSNVTQVIYDIRQVLFVNRHRRVILPKHNPFPALFDINFYRLSGWDFKIAHSTSIHIGAFHG